MGQAARKVTARDGRAVGVACDYSRDGTLRSIEDSLERLSLGHIDFAVIHDLDPYNHGKKWSRRFSEAMNSAYPALDALRRTGVLRAVGVGVNDWRVCEACIAAADFDVFLLAGRYTLLEHAALDSFLPLCATRGIGVIVGAPFNTGILARGAGKAARYNHRPAPSALQERVAAIAAICGRHGVSLAAAALQFPLGHPAVAAVLPGPRNVAQAEACARWMAEPIPAALWQDLKAAGLLPAMAPVPGD